MFRGVQQIQHAHKYLLEKKEWREKREEEDPGHSIDSRMQDDSEGIAM